MKKQAINLSWPATLSFSAASGNENERFTRGKLKVFYRGMTADKRFFSDEFSDELVKSLPYTPIVSHYDEEKDDFVGHATQQNIYGIVDPCSECTFETDDDGVTWCVCDTVYYTERPDKVGEIAKKIEGHSQSLELDPSTVKYTINYDEKRHFKNIEFTAGKFVGVSVLGTDQQPAFTGSSFFNYDEEFENKMKLLREYCETNRDQTSGGNEMNLQEFMKLSWGDISVKVEEAICAEYQEEAFTYVVDMFNDSAIIRFYSYIDGTCKLMRVMYSCDDNGTVTLGNVNEVHIVYEDVKAAIEETGVEQATLAEASVDIAATNEDDADSFKKDEEPSEADDEEKEDKEDDEFADCKDDKKKECAEDSKDSSEDDPKDDEEDKKEEEDKDPEDCACGDKEKKSKCVVDAACADAATDAAQVTNAEVTETIEKVSVENEQIPQENSSATSFAESERAELESLKREKKVNLIKDYKDYLTEDEVTDFTSRIDDFSEEKLEIELLKKYKNYQEVNTPRKPMRAFALSAPIKNTSADTLDELVRKNLNR